MLIDTHWHPEQTGANEIVGPRRRHDLRAREDAEVPEPHGLRADRRRIGSIRSQPLPEAARPTKTMRGDGSLEFAGRKIDYGYLPAAHTDGDLFVHFPELNVLAAGGVVSGEQLAAARLPQRRVVRRPRARARAARGAREARHARRARAGPAAHGPRHRAAARHLRRACSRP